MEAPVAVQTGEGPIQFSGQTIPFDQATLDALYPSAQAYIQAVEGAAQAAVDGGFYYQPMLKPLLRKPGKSAG